MFEVPEEHDVDACDNRGREEESGNRDRGKSHEPLIDRSKQNALKSNEPARRKEKQPISVSRPSALCDIRRQPVHSRDTPLIFDDDLPDQPVQLGL